LIDKEREGPEFVTILAVEIHALELLVRPSNALHGVVSF